MITNQRMRRLLAAGGVLLALLLGGALLTSLAPGGRNGYAVPDGGTVGLAPPSATAVTATALPPTLAPSPPALPATVAPSPTPTVAPSRTPTALPATALPATIPAGSATPVATGGFTVTPTATPTAIPPETPQPAAWLHRATAHYDLYYLPDSPAAHDIARLATMSETALQQAAARLQAPPTTRIRIYFVNRIFWQGGASYVGNELLLSYPDAAREYTSTSLARVLQHETTHALVEQLLGSPDHKGGLLGEGVAVWDAGGHYQTEPLGTLASTLVGDNADLYLSLTDLRRDFYGAQHEIAYLEGGAYVQWLVARWGLPQFKQYLAQPDDPQPIYGLDSAGLEAAWRTWLAAQPHTAADSAAVRLRVRYYDLMRRYEVALDPHARLLPDPSPSQWGPTLLAVFRRPASAPLNQALEADFVRAGTALWSRDLATCARLLDSIAARIP
ncbi:MAG: hypothetical protein M3Z04_03420 [Chloroflexota bacterium]|nr:hypothetical protein [Chloroflexota bacterium]